MLELLEGKSGEVGQTILKQMGGWGRLKAMIGAKHAATISAASDSEYGQKLGGVSFQFPRPGGRGKPNHIKILLNGKDLYDVEFGSRHGYKYKVIKTYNDMQASQLKSLFEKITGLRLSL